MFGEDFDSEGSSFVVAIGAEIIGSRTEGIVTMNAFCNGREKLFIRLPPLARNVVASRLKILWVPNIWKSCNGELRSCGPWSGIRSSSCQTPCWLPSCSLKFWRISQLSFLQLWRKRIIQISSFVANLWLILSSRKLAWFGYRHIIASSVTTSIVSFL